MQNTYQTSKEFNMLAHNLKEILEIVPEAMGLIKRANLEEDFPTDCKDSVIASYLRVNYLEKYAEKAVDPTTKTLVEKAASLYEVDKDLAVFISRFSQGSFEKKASETSSRYSVSLLEKQAYFEGSLGGFLNIEKAAEAAQELYQASPSEITSQDVLRYAGRAYLNKEAAVKTLANRYHATKDPSFVKVAQLAANSIREDDFDSINELCKTVTQLDKKAGLDIIGFNFYREALLTKVSELASCLHVNLAGEQVPYEKILRFGKGRISSTLGKDIGEAITENPAEDKVMLEALPRDLQRMLGSLVK